MDLSKLSGAIDAAVSASGNVSTHFGTLKTDFGALADFIKANPPADPAAQAALQAQVDAMATKMGTMADGLAAVDTAMQGLDTEVKALQPNPPAAG